MDPLSIVMYHYVRPIETSLFPGIKGLELDLFRQQLDYIERFYSFVSADDVIRAIKGGAKLPSRPVLLTFDDGFSDHYVHVLPILAQRNITGAFFPPVNAITSGEVLDVHKIHFILASGAPTSELISAMEGFISDYQSEYSLHTIEEYRAQYLTKQESWDSPETIYFKRLLQHALPLELRVKISDKLFRKFVTENERGFAETLYVSIDQLKLMKKLGMHIGGHGSTHSWLNTLSRADQNRELQESKDFLLENKLCDEESWIFCYPYGAYNHDSLDLLKEQQCQFAVTTRVDIGPVNDETRLILPRLDTNHLPKQRTAESNEWTQKVYQLI